MNPITAFSGDNAFLSNFHPVTIQFMGKDWPSVEHAYQAFKTSEKALQEHIRHLPTAKAAKKAGRVVPLRSDWEKIKVPLMKQLVRCKFFENLSLAEMLLETGWEELIERNTWHDNFFGDCSCLECAKYNGRNWLGIILMEVRIELREIGCQ